MREDDRDEGTPSLKPTLQKKSVKPPFRINQHSI